MPLFDAYIAVDWSASSTPKSGKDSIWIAAAGEGLHVPPVNPSTRREAYSLIRGAIETALSHNKRLLIGFDFAFGYPRGMAGKIGVSGWRGIWEWLDTHITDGPKNKNSRFEIAAKLNQKIGGDAGPFWGHPHQHAYDGLTPRTDSRDMCGLPEKRLIEACWKSCGLPGNPMSVWQLAYTGAVGSQVLMGLPYLQKLRAAFPHDIAIWPFETDFDTDLSKPIIIAEIYPSSHPIESPNPNDVLDKQQVLQVAADMARWDEAGELKAKLSAPAQLTEEERKIVTSEEGWIFGASS